MVDLLSKRPELPGGPYLVVGLARSGLAALRLLRGRGEQVEGVDSGVPDIGHLAGPGRSEGVFLGVDGIEQLERAATVVKSPGVPREAPVIAAARERGVPVLGELELAWRLLPNDFVAVTGTNGKTTTVELIGHIHRSAGVAVAVAGNVGTALSSLVGALDQEAVVVCEASSFQLEDADAFAPEAGVLLNLEPDHLDRHGSFADYRAAKLSMFARQTPDDVALAPAGITLPGTARRVAPADVDGWTLGLRGAHNRVNAAYAAGVCLARGLPLNAVRDGLRTFSGVEHRLEEVAEIDGVLYVNDSKATNVASTLTALDAFVESPVHLILGGRGKSQDFAPLRTAAARCAGVYLIGEDGRTIADGEWCGTLEAAVACARRHARRGDVVLLSPACASFDQFADYEARGRRFKELVV